MSYDVTSASASSSALPANDDSCIRHLRCNADPRERVELLDTALREYPRDVATHGESLYIRSTENKIVTVKHGQIVHPVSGAWVVLNGYLQIRCYKASWNLWSNKKKCSQLHGPASYKVIHLTLQPWNWYVR